MAVVLVVLAIWLYVSIANHAEVKSDLPGDSDLSGAPVFMDYPPSWGDAS